MFLATIGGADIDYVESAPATPLMQGILLGDADLPGHFAGGSLGLTVSGDGAIELRAGSSFVVSDRGDGSFGLAQLNGTIETPIGDISGLGTTNLQITNFTAGASLARLNDLLDEFTFFVSGGAAVTGERLVTLSFNDGGHDGGPALTAQRTQALAVTAANAPPVLDLDASEPGTGAAATFIEGKPAILITPNGLVSDDNANFAGGSLRVEMSNGHVSQDLFTILNQGSGPGQIGYADGVISYEGQVIAHLLPTPLTSRPILDIRFFSSTPGEIADVPVEAVQALIRAISYDNLSQAPNETTRNIAFTLRDTGGLTTTATATLDVTVSNHRPTGTDATLTVAEDGEYVFTVDDFGFSDVDGDSFMQVNFLAPNGGTLYHLVHLGALGTAWVPVDFTTGLLSIGFHVAWIEAGWVTFRPHADVHGNGQASIPFRVMDSGDHSDGFQTSARNPSFITFNITPVDDPGVARSDAFATDENLAVTGNLLADNGSGADSDVDGPALSILQVNGSAVDFGSPIVLASGALLTVNADGVFTWDPNGAFNSLAAAGSGASNTQAADSFSYTLTNGNTAMVTIGIDGVDSNDTLQGTAGNDFLSGGGGLDLMIGGAGDDYYVVNSPGDAVVEAPGRGLDTVYTSVSTTLSDDVERLGVNGFTTTFAINLTGNGLANEMWGNDGANMLDGGGGADVMNGFGGNDFYLRRRCRRRGGGEGRRRSGHRLHQHHLHSRRRCRAARRQRLRHHLRDQPHRQRSRQRDVGQ